MKTFAPIIAVFSILPSFVAAQSVRPADYLAITQVIARIVDSEPWNASMSNGRSARLTLNLDGSGTFEDPIAMSIAWDIKLNDICINFRMAGAYQCFRFVAMNNGFEAYSAGRLVFALMR